MGRENATHPPLGTPEVEAMTRTTKYEKDFYAWANEQAEALRSGDIGALDIGNLATELESLGKGECRLLEQRLEALAKLLLSWRYHKVERGRALTMRIENARDVLDTLLKESPSLKPLIPDAVAKIWPWTRVAWKREDEKSDVLLDDLPTVCPWAADRFTDWDFLPE